MTKQLSLLVFSSLAMLATSASAKEKVRFDSTFKVSEFNSVASQYMMRPTFLELTVRENKPDQLYIFTDFVRKSDNARAMGGYEFISFSQSAVDDYIAAADKYLAWQAIASKDGDILDKEISRTMGRKKSLKIKFTFYSGNARDHYLTMQHCAVGTCLEPSLALNIDNVKLFKMTMENWKAGRLIGLSSDEIDDKYK